jgi:hypothetical protein
LESALDRGGASVEYASVKGNELSGYFTLTYRGHTTYPIDFNAADTVVKSRLESLPNIGKVSVSRFGPSVWKEFSWVITFLEMPGAFPYGAGNFEQLTANPLDSFTGIVHLLGLGSDVAVNTDVDGSPVLEGTFHLLVTSADGTEADVTGIPADASDSEFAYLLNQLPNIGTVSVVRFPLENGYTWQITFDGCKIVNGSDVCNEGQMPLIRYDSALSNVTCDISTVVIVEGSGPDNCESGECAVFISDVLDGHAKDIILDDLTTGSPYFVRVLAHNSEGFGYPAISKPEFLVPTYNPPGTPPPVRLHSSTSTSITLVWDFPRENGGAPVMGFELWMDDWAGGFPRLAFDGTDQPEVTSFTVSTGSSLVVEAGKSYRFMVRAINYCISTEPDVVCYGEFSDTAVYAVRSPRVPLAPPMPYRHSTSSIGNYSSNDATITIRWLMPTDNGGSPILSYLIYWAAPSSSSYSMVAMDVGDLLINDANVDSLGNVRVLQFSHNGLKEGNVYRYYIVAVNAKGRSPASPIASIVAAVKAGIDASGNLTYATVQPTVTEVDEKEISLRWNMPSSLSTGGTPITGYRVFMYPGVSVNTLANPQVVFNEVQLIQTSVAAKLPEIQLLSFSGSSPFALSIYGSLGALTLSAGASSPSSIANYIADLLNQTMPGSKLPSVSSWNASNDGQWSVAVTFDGIDGPVDLMAVQLPSNSAVFSSVEVIRKGTEKISGSFALSFNDAMTVDLPYDVSAEEMKVRKVSAFFKTLSFHPLYSGFARRFSGSGNRNSH